MNFNTGIDHPPPLSQPNTQVAISPSIPTSKPFTAKEETKTEEPVANLDTKALCPTLPQLGRPALLTFSTSAVTSNFPVPQNSTAEQTLPTGSSQSSLGRNLSGRNRGEVSSEEFASASLQHSDNMWREDDLAYSLDDLMFEPDEDDRRILYRNMVSEVIKLIPAQPFKSANNTEERCPICLELYNIGDPTKTIECRHTFHKTCLDEWLFTAIKCPLCRHPLI
eukprot:TRINITY_DN13024_c0_g6_i1.p1 TRINITY_DN13024_c0_g6~~TRINITY_DN13024_c0_g6_i1.p1  ORF type:complete len:223 (-),score=14.00 TRINITY_DN13024_c0_g6_i1:110-778(-)